MPPCYDIYALTKRRDKATIEKFLNYYCFRERVENREGDEICVFVGEKHRVDKLTISVKTLSEVIEYGIKNPHHAFVFYIGKDLKGDFNDLILKFTYDGKIIFGVSIESERLSEDNVLIANDNVAQTIEKAIASLTDAAKTSIQFEHPPADDEDEFDEDKEFWATTWRKK